MMAGDYPLVDGLLTALFLLFLISPVSAYFGSGLMPTKISAGSSGVTPSNISTPTWLRDPGLSGRLPREGVRGARAFISAATSASSGPVTIIPIRGEDDEIIAPMRSTTGTWISSSADLIWAASNRASMSVPYDQILIWRSAKGFIAILN